MVLSLTRLKPRNPNRTKKLVTLIFINIKLSDCSFQKQLNAIKMGFINLFSNRMTSDILDY